MAETLGSFPRIAQSTPFAARVSFAFEDVRNLMKFSAASRCRVLVRGTAV
jgi:hypothetical protein